MKKHLSCSPRLLTVRIGNRGGGKGIPLGNLTSQLFANVYMDEFDQFMKHTLRVKNYLRYTDDFIMVHTEEEYLRELISPVREFLKERLQLDLHPRKIVLNKLGQGFDFLGYVILPHHRVLRTKTKRRMFKKIKRKALAYRQGETDLRSLDQTLQSYLGLLQHCHSQRLRQSIKRYL